MPASSTGKKNKLSITQCTVDTSGKVTPDESKKFEVMLNPSGFNHTLSIEYNKDKAQGQIASDLKFNQYQSEKVSFDLLLDGTGVVSGSNSSVKDQVKSLSSIVYNYEGASHEPNHVRLFWGSFIFYGRLDSINLDYTLFKPNGEPLRAKIKLSFTGFMSNEEEALKAGKSSPDLTHTLEFKAGDTLPLMCYKIYRDCSYYLKIAEFNNITNFRNIKAGTRIHFPPLK